MNHTGVAASFVRHFFCLCNLTPSFRRTVVVPHVTKLVVVVVLAAKDEEMAVVVAACMACPCAGFAASTLGDGALLTINAVSLFGSES